MDSKDYKISKNYDLLIKLLDQQKRVVCFVDYDARSEHPCRDIALARSFKSALRENETIYEAGVRGIGYLYGFGKEDFKTQCEETNLEFIEPNKE